MATSRITVAQKRKFLAFLAEGGSIEAAARAAGANARRFFTLRQNDPVFAEAVAEAMEAGADMAEQRMWDYALGRVEVKSMAPVTALFGILKARRPRVWAERHQAAALDQPGVPDLANFDLSKLSDQELRDLTALVAKAHAARLPEPSRA